MIGFLCCDVDKTWSRLSVTADFFQQNSQARFLRRQFVMCSLLALNQLLQLVVYLGTKLLLFCDLVDQIGSELLLLAQEFLFVQIVSSADGLLPIAELLCLSFDPCG